MLRAVIPFGRRCRLSGVGFVNYDFAMGKNVDVDDLIGPAEIVAIIGPATLGNANDVSIYRRRTGFPQPLIEKGRRVLWLCSHIEVWAEIRA